MLELNQEKIHVKSKPELEKKESFIPRMYSLTHSDITGDLFLTVDMEYEEEELSNFYTKIMRDEVLAQWQINNGVDEFHIYVHVSGGFVIRWAGMRDRILRHYLPHTIRVMRYGDAQLFDTFPFLDDAPIFVHFKSNKKKYNKVEKYGIFKDYT